MNNYYHNQNSSDNQQPGGVFGGNEQQQNIMQPQNDFSEQRQGLQAQSKNSQYLQENKEANNQAPVSKTSFNPKEVTPEMKKTYENIFNNYGVDAANNWLKQQIINKHINLQSDNDAVLREIQAKHAEVFSIPAVQKAIDAYIQMDLDPSISLRDQGFHDAMEHISAIYRAGYDSAMNLKNQNDSAKSRMSSAVNSAVPHYQSNKVFTRSEIRAMSPEDFIRNEKAIFEQLNRGLIK
jgi:hypothetical protein